MSASADNRITAATAAAHEAIARLCAARGERVTFVQSAGCRAGSTPMCYADGEFVIGDIDVLLGDIDGCAFYIDRRLDEAWHRQHFILDVAAGNPEDFSLPAGHNLHFVTRSPALDTCPAPTPTPAQADRAYEVGRSGPTDRDLRLDCSASPAPTINKAADGGSPRPHG
jgi:uncharacterized protein (DUF779 family)